MRDTPATPHNMKWVYVVTQDGNLSYREDTHFMQLAINPYDGQPLISFVDFRRYIMAVTTMRQGCNVSSIALMNTGKMLLVAPQHRPN